MIRIPLVVHYADGRAPQHVTATQYAIAQYAVHCQSTGRPAPRLPANGQQPTDVGMDQIEQLRYMAYVELRRGNTGGTFPSWARWDASVDEVTGGEAETADPTPPAT